MKPGLKKGKHIEGYVNSRELEKILDCISQSLSNFKKDGRLPPPSLIKGKAHYWSVDLIPEIKKTFEIGE